MTATTSTLHVRPNGADPRRTDEPLDWYRDAIIYELHVRAFADANGCPTPLLPGGSRRTRDST